MNKYFKQYKLEYLDNKHHLLSDQEKDELKKLDKKNLREEDKISELKKIEDNVIKRIRSQNKDTDFFRLESKEAAMDFHKRQQLMQIQYQLSMARSYEQDYEKALKDYSNN